MDNVKLAHEFDQFQHTPETSPELQLWASVAAVAVSDAKRGNIPAMYWVRQSELFEDICSWLGLNVELARNAVLPADFNKLARVRSKRKPRDGSPTFIDNIEGLYPFEVELLQQLDAMTLVELETYCGIEPTKPFDFTHTFDSRGISNGNLH
jgi:hypothetical protein